MAINRKIIRTQKQPKWVPNELKNARNVLENSEKKYRFLNSYCNLDFSMFVCFLQQLVKIMFQN